MMEIDKDKKMELTVSHEQGLVPVTVLHVEGRVDGSNYKQVIARAQELYDGGARNLLFDLKKVTFLSSAGMSALHRTAKLFQGAAHSELEEGWAEFRAMGRDRDAGYQKHVKLLAPPEPVCQTLELVGFTHYFEIFEDLEKAVASFQ
jgi:anti-anti-sigma regulatory factor